MKKLTITLFSLCAITCQKKIETNSIYKIKTIEKAGLGQTVSAIQSNKHELKANLDIISKALVSLMDDPNFTALVASRASFGDYSVKLSELYTLCAQEGVDLEQQMVGSLHLCGSANKDILKFKSIFKSFELGGFTFEPKINFVSLKEENFVRNGWDGKTPCYIATSLFYLPANKIPAYSKVNGQLLKENLDVYFLQKKPTWHVSFSHNIPAWDENGNPIEPIHKLLAQNVECHCVLTNDEPPSEYCDYTDNPRTSGANCPNTTDPKTGECNGVCDPIATTVNVVTLEPCTQLQTP